MDSSTARFRGMACIQTEGVVLDATPYQDHHHITTLYSYELGLVRLFVRGTLRSRQHSHALVTPLTRGEFLIQSGRETLYRLRDGAIRHPYLGLRESAAQLRTACAMARALLKSQLPLKPSPPLYSLFTRYLDQLQERESHPGRLLLSFYLKLMKHEGVLAEGDACCDCGEITTTPYLGAQGLFCHKHAPVETTSLKLEEWQALQRAAHLRRLTEIQELEVTETLGDKVEEIWARYVEK